MDEHLELLFIRFDEVSHQNLHCVCWGVILLSSGNKMDFDEIDISTEAFANVKTLYITHLPELKWNEVIFQSLLVEE